MEHNGENKRLKKEDKISDLPIEISHDILSRLSTKEAARTSVLSKTWNAIWHTMPVLDFKMNRVNPNYIRRLGHEQQMEFLGRYINFMNFVNHTMQRSQDHGANVNKFSLQTIIMHSETLFPQVDGWLEFVCMTGSLDTMKLVLKCVVYPQPRYQLPPTIAASANSLVKLTLNGHIRIDQAAPFNNHVLFTALKTLTLTYVYANDEVVSNICSSCPALTILAFIFCTGLKHIKVQGLTNLDGLLIHDGNTTGLEKIHVDVPSLTRLSYGSVFMRSCEINIESCIHLRTFSIAGMDAVAIGKLLLVTEPFLLVTIHCLPQLKAPIFQDVTNSRVVDIPGNRLKNMIFVLREYLLVAKMDIPNTSPEDFVRSRLLVLKIPNPRQLETELNF